jgi:hypothetical protein
MKKIINKTNILLFVKGWLLKILLFAALPVFAQTSVQSKKIAGKHSIEKMLLKEVVLSYPAAVTAIKQNDVRNIQTNKN